MGILANALSIVSGSFFGGIFKERIRFKNFTVLSISIMIISLVGFFENIFDVSEVELKSGELLVVIFSLIIGTTLGDMLKLENRICSISSFVKKDFSALLDGIVFFGVGGLQICGPMMLALSGDSSQLVLKSMIDFPFALMFGISYGKRIAFSALPVAIGQFLIFLLTCFAESFLDVTVIKQLCAMGYIILFFSGFNLICPRKYKVNNINMIIGIFIILFYNMVLNLWR